MHLLTFGFFLPKASSDRSTNISALYRQHEMAKKREHGDKGSRISCVHVTCIFNSGRNGEKDNRCIAELLAQKRKSEYGITVAWMP